MSGSSDQVCDSEELSDRSEERDDDGDGQRGSRVGHLGSREAVRSLARILVTSSSGAVNAGAVGDVAEGLLAELEGAVVSDTAAESGLGGDEVNGQ